VQTGSFLAKYHHLGVQVRDHEPANNGPDEYHSLPHIGEALIRIHPNWQRKFHVHTNASGQKLFSRSRSTVEAYANLKEVNMTTNGLYMPQISPLSCISKQMYWKQYWKQQWLGPCPLFLFLSLSLGAFFL
jgi:hypothetical protein